MIKTGNYIKSLLDHGLVDDAVGVEGGWDIQYKNNILSVRLDNKGGALLYNQKRGNVVEVKSGRLDDVLHRYIVQSLFGLQTKEGTRGTMCKDAFFVPTKVVKNSLVLEDPEGRKFTVSGASPRALLNYYNEAAAVNADDCMLLLSGFSTFDRAADANVSEAVDGDVEMRLLKCSCDIDEYSVCAKSGEINDVGQTIVGNFLCSSADKVAQITFEEDCRKAFSSATTSRRGITSSAARVKNPLAAKAQEILSSAAAKKAVGEYLDAKYPDGLCVSSIEQVMAYEAPSLIKAAAVEGEVPYKGLFAQYLKDADQVSFRLDSNKSILCSLAVAGKSAAKFRAVPDLGIMKSALQRHGYLLSELSDGVEFSASDGAVSAIVNSCESFAPVCEKMSGRANIVSKVVGAEAGKVLSSYGINDEKGVFNQIVSIEVN